MNNILKAFPQDKLDLLSKEEEKKIFKNLKDCGARERILYSHVRMVVKLAKKYEGYGLDLEDLVSEGCAGLFLAMDHFDENKGAKFSYYASFWIKQAIIRGLAKHGRLIRLPAGITADFLNILKLFDTYEEKGKEHPSYKEVANKLKMPLQRVKNILDATKYLVFIDSQAGNESGNRSERDRLLGEAIEDKGAVLPIEKMEKEEREKALAKYISKLSERERVIIKERFGLIDGRGQTLREIAGKLELSRERVRQIEEQTLSKLKEMFDEETVTQ